MLLKLKNGNQIKIEKSIREYNTRMPDHDIMTVTVKYEPAVFDTLLESLSPDNTSEITIVNDDNSSNTYSGFAVDNMIEVNSFHTHDVAIRFQKNRTDSASNEY